MWRKFNIFIDIYLIILWTVYSVGYIFFSYKPDKSTVAISLVVTMTVWLKELIKDIEDKE